MLSAVNPKPASRRNKPTRRVRGERPRGPKPQVCDLCQLRKAKCDRQLPRCSLCQKVNRPCTYDRNGFGETTSDNKPEVVTKLVVHNTTKGSNFTKLSNSIEHLLIHSVVHQSLMALKRSHVIIEADGNFVYVGPSIATHYVTRNQKLLSSLSKPFVPDYEPVSYNRSIPIEITRTLILQLIELYFAYINAFYPIVEPGQFYSQFHQGCKTPSFEALLNIICLSGASFYPNRTFGRIIAIHFSKLATQSMRAIILMPSIQAVQTFMISALHISVCEEKTVIEGAWLASGIANNMSVLLGLTCAPSRFPCSTRDFRQRLCWMVNIADVIISHCCGRPLNNNATQDISLPSYSSLLPSVNFTCPSVFLVPEVMSPNCQANQNYFRNYCAHAQLVARRIKLQERYEEQDRKQSSISKGSLSKILNPTASLSRPYLDGSLSLEREFLQWYQSLPNVGPKTRRNHSYLYLPLPSDFHTSMIAVLFFSSLVDLNKPFISNDMKVTNIPYGRAFSLTNYLNATPLEKCVQATFYGFQVIYNSGGLVVELGLPYVWYSIIQLTFFFTYIAHQFPISHWAVQPAIRNATFLFNQFEQNADRWALLRDAYFMIKPFIQLLSLRSQAKCLRSHSTTAPTGQY